MYIPTVGTNFFTRTIRGVVERGRKSLSWLQSGLFSTYRAITGVKMNNPDKSWVNRGAAAISSSENHKNCSLTRTLLSNAEKEVVFGILNDFLFRVWAISINLPGSFCLTKQTKEMYHSRVRHSQKPSISYEQLVSVGLTQPLSTHPHPACKLANKGVCNQKRIAQKLPLDSTEREKHHFWSAISLMRYLINFSRCVGSVWKLHGWNKTSATWLRWRFCGAAPTVNKKRSDGRRCKRRLTCLPEVYRVCPKSCPKYYPEV